MTSLRMESAFGEQLRMRHPDLLLGTGHTGDAVIIEGYSGPMELLQWVARMPDAAWVLVERTAGGVAVGPVFGPGLPCIACYLRRLDSNGNPPPRSPVTAADAVRVAGLLPVLAAAGTGVQIEALDDGSRRWHRLLPLPHCPCSHDVDRSGLTILDAVSERLGLVHHVEQIGESLGRTICAATGSHTGVFRDGGTRSDGLGCARDPAAAVEAAIGEALERYAAGFVPPGLHLASRDDLDADSIAASAYRYGNLPVTSSTVLRWVTGESLRDGRPVMVPAADVYLPYLCSDDEPGASRTSSEGLAAAPTVGQARRRAALESVERNSTMRVWRSGGPVATLAHSAVPEPRPDGLHLVHIPSRADAVVVAALIESDRVPYCSAGAAARLDLADAAAAAVDEAILVRELARIRIGADPDTSLGASDRRFTAHAVQHDLRRSRQRWLTAPPAETVPTKMSWSGLVASLPTAVAVDVTTADVAALGVRVERVVVDGCVGLDPPGGTPRLTGHQDPHPLG